MTGKAYLTNVFIRFQNSLASVKLKQIENRKLMNNQDQPIEPNDLWDDELIHLFDDSENTKQDHKSASINVTEAEDYWSATSDLPEASSFTNQLESSSEPLAFLDLDLDEELGDLEAGGNPSEIIINTIEQDSSSTLTQDEPEDLLQFATEHQDKIDLNLEDLDLAENDLLERESARNDKLNWQDLEQELSITPASQTEQLNDLELQLCIQPNLDNLEQVNDLEELLELDSNLQEIIVDDSFEDLENIFEESLPSDTLGELDDLLEPSLLEPSLVKSYEPESKSFVKASSVRSTSQAQSPNNQTFDQTMRVSVRKLDSLNNMIGELVVKRNRLEEDQERLRLFLDNLLNHIQSLGDVGARMHDLYEKSLLEGALLASRQQNQSSKVSSRKTQSGFFNSNSEPEKDSDDELSALEMDRFTGFHLLSQDIVELIVRIREASSDIQFVVDETDKVTQSLRQVTIQLQEGINSSRMTPFGQTADRLPRAVRNISHQLKKQVELEIEGKEVLIDKMIVEHLYNPMTHLVNNAITHGIESPQERVLQGKPATGKIKIRAFIQGNQTVISVSDDGAGIDSERVKAKAVEKNLLTWAQAQNLSQQEVYDLLFHAGFSTKDKADDFAGRGVGMDVVSTDLKKIRGTINIESEVGKGTTFTIRLPLVLSICKALTCSYNNTRIAFPIDGVEEAKEYSLSEIQTNSNGVKCINWNNTLLPFQSLSNLLSYNRQLSRANIYGGSQTDEDTVSVIILHSGDHLLAVQVDQILGEQEIVIKQIEGPVPKPAGIAGATVLGDGTIMPIGDVLELIEIAQGKRTTEIGLNLWQSQTDRVQIPTEPIKNEPLVLVVDDSITVRELLTLSFNKLGYRVEQARDGQEGWDKLRNGLPCDMIFCDIEMPRMNGLELLSNLQKDEKLNLIPVAMLTSRGAEKHRKLATDLGAKAYLTKPYTEKELMDVAQRLIEINRANQAANSMVVNSKSTGVGQAQLSKDERTQPIVLIIDDSVTVRELLSMTFKKAGFQVEQARDGQEAWDKLKAGLDCDLAFCDIEMPRLNGLELLARLQEDEKLSSLPVAMLTSRGAQKMRNIAAKRGAKGYFVKPYVEDALLDAAHKMINGEILLENINLDNLEPAEH
ncbi:putative CheA signal transduction histidine kinase [Stanieria sp. NIES-3757]|nr:putative CheA signal transduction histidine kinase [Stanieria sp. NIES-3757]